MKPSLLLISTIFLCVALAPAQDPVRPQPQAKTGSPLVRFEQDWPALNPPRYFIEVDAQGHATYRSEPAADSNGGSAPDSYVVEWTATEATCSKVFESIKKLNYLQGHFASKAKVANTGIKTLGYKDAEHDASTTYNYSDNPVLRDLTQIFQSIAATAETGRRLAHDLRFDKLGVDAELKALQEQQRSNQAIEFDSVRPILQKIADDPAMMRMSQQRAKEILKSAGPGAEPSSTAEK